MNISIQTVHFDADKKLLDFVQKKLDKLQTFHDRITKIEVYLKLESMAHAIKEKVVEIKIHIPKQDCFVKASATADSTRKPRTTTRKHPARTQSSSPSPSATRTCTRPSFTP